jgi:hypothetical protein
MGRILRIAELLDKAKARSFKYGTHPLRGCLVRPLDQAKEYCGRMGFQGVDEENGIDSWDESLTESSVRRLILSPHPAVRVPERAKLLCK